MSTPTGATFFAHVHDVYMEPVGASTWIQLRVPLPRFLRLGTSRLSRKQRAMDPGCGTYRREGKDTGQRGMGTCHGGHHRHRTFTGADVRKTSVRFVPK
jgi:hypothetical protein